MSDNRNYSIRVINERGYGASGAKVSIHFSTMSGNSQVRYTDSDGWAKFVAYPPVTPFGAFQFIANAVYVNGEKVSDGFEVEDGDSFSFTLP
jgi:hypothetical protein